MSWLALQDGPSNLTPGDLILCGLFLVGCYTVVIGTILWDNWKRKKK